MDHNSSDALVQLLQMGELELIRDAVERCDWGKVKQLVEEHNLSKELREEVFDELLSSGLLGHALLVLKKGVDEGRVKMFVQELCQRKRWDLVSDMLREDALRSTLREFLMQSAVSCGHDEAALVIVRLQPLTDSELMEVMTAAVNNTAHQFLLNVIKQTQNGRKLFNQLCLRQQWKEQKLLNDVLANLLKARELELALYFAAAHHMWETFDNLCSGNPTIQENVSRFPTFNRTVSKSGNCDGIVAAVQQNLLTDLETYTLISTAVDNNNFPFLLGIIRDTTNGRRLLKELCSRRLCNADIKQVSDLYTNLLKAKEKDLALCLAVTRREWRSVAALYNDRSIAFTTRRSALFRAVHHGAWSHVIQMVCTAQSVTRRRDYRQIFLEAVRQGKWRRALKLCKTVPNFALSKHDHRFTVLFLRSLKKFKGVIRVCKYFRKRFPKLLLEKDITAALMSAIKERLGHGVKTNSSHILLEAGCTNFVLQRLICHRDWNYVTYVLTLVDLTSKQRKYVCDRALASGAVECAVKVLNLETSDDQIAGIIKDHLQRDSWQLVLQLCEADGAGKRIRNCALKVAVESGHEDIIETLLQLSDVTGGELNKALTEVHGSNALQFLHRIIEHVTQGQPVIPQPRSASASRHLSDEQVRHDIVNAVNSNEFHFFLNMIKTKKDRRLMKMICLEEQWVNIVSALRLYACLVKADEVDIALHLVANNQLWICVEDLLKNSSFSSCVAEYCQTCGNSSQELELLRVVTVESIKADNLQCFLNVLYECRGRLSVKLLESACRLAIDSGKFHFVLEVCRTVKKYPYVRKMQRLAAEMGLREEKWNFVRQLVVDCGVRFSVELFVGCLRKMVVTRGSWITCACFLEEWLKNKQTSLFIVSRNWRRRRQLNRLHAGEFNDWCLTAGFPHLAVSMSLLTQTWQPMKWDALEVQLEQCENQTVVNMAVTEAASRSKWDFVARNVDKCSLPEAKMTNMLTSVVISGHAACVSVLLQKVDPSVTTATSVSLLRRAVKSEGDREEILRLCVGAGLSTFQRHVAPFGDNSPMQCALKNGQLPLVRILYESGSSNNRELHQLKNDAGIRTQLQDQHRQDIVEYIDQAFSNPHSLQNLCRLAVSHLVGCRPGRKDRVLSLELAWCLHDSILFKDIVTS